jgi:hypothetical protein
MPQNEVVRLLSLTEGNTLKVIEILEKQLNTLYMRAQVLMSLAGVTLSITGFSGRAIAGANRVSQILVVAGLAVVLSSAVWIYVSVMSIKWITAEIQPDTHAFLTTIVQRRNKKTVAYSVGGKILLAGLGLYCIAFSIMLLHI